MTDKLLKIIEHYGLHNQLRKFNEETFELEESIINYEQCKNSGYEYDYIDAEELEKEYKEHIAEEIADVLVMVYQFLEYYKIDQVELCKTMDFKIDRQLERIKNEQK